MYHHSHNADFKWNFGITPKWMIHMPYGRQFRRVIGGFLRTR